MADHSPVAVVALAGAIDVASAAVVRAQVEAALGAAPARLVLDLSDTGFVDSTGLGTLIDLHRQASTAGVRFALRHPPSQLQRLMVMTETYSTFDWA